MCLVSLMHVIFALGAFPILAHVPPSTFSCFKSSAPIRHLSKHVSKDCREAGPVLALCSIAKMVSVPGTRLFELPAEDCFSHWFCLTGFVSPGRWHLPHPWLSCLPGLVFPVVSAHNGIPPPQPKCTARVCLSVSPACVP